MIEVEPNWWVLGLMSVLLAVLHIAFPAIDGHIRRHESVAIGLIGGVATGYVVLYMLPKIAGMSNDASGGDPPGGLALYYVLLASIVIYLSAIYLDLSHSVLSPFATFFDYLVHGSYSLLVGYVFVELSTASAMTNTLIVLVLGCHLLGMNHLLRSARTRGFDRVLRWVLCALVLSGTLVGLSTEVPRALVSTVTAFLGGIILVNVIAEELPLRHQDRLPWFIVGVGSYLGVTWLSFALDPIT